MTTETGEPEFQAIIDDIVRTSWDAYEKACRDAGREPITPVPVRLMTWGEGIVRTIKLHEVTPDAITVHMILETEWQRLRRGHFVVGSN